MWGITVDTVGSQTVPPGYEVYPPRVGHPSGFYFDVGKGRILESYQLLYITSGRGLFYGCSRERIEIGPGDMILLRPNRWHSYRPDRETGWHEYWIGFRGPNVDARFRNDFFDDNLEVFRVGVREEIVDLYDKAREVAENERSSYRSIWPGLPICCWGWRCITTPTTSSCRRRSSGRSTVPGASCATSFRPASLPRRWPAV